MIFRVAGYLTALVLIGFGTFFLTLGMTLMEVRP